jgi:hypothetical protein
MDEANAVTYTSYKEFIENILIKEIGEIKNSHHYLSLSLICEGIEFLGKYISDDDWEETQVSEKQFINALSTFKALKKYNKYYTNGNGDPCSFLYRSIRCGFCHSLSPSSTDKKGYGYDSTLGEYGKSEIISEGNKCKIYININSLYDDFVEACNELLNDSRLSNNNKRKIQNNFLRIAPHPNLDNVCVSGVTIEATTETTLGPTLEIKI